MNNNQKSFICTNEDPPAIDTSTAATIAEEHYDIDGTISEIGGERDRNFRIDASCGSSFVLKVSRCGKNEVIEFQTEALQHISRSDPQLPVVELVLTADGNPWTVVENGGSRVLVRVFEFITSADRSISNLSSDSLVHYGAVIARVGRALRGFFHPAARYSTPWDFRNAPELESSLSTIKDDRRRAMAKRVLERFDESVQPTLCDLRAQVIHNDLRPDNVLLGEHDEVVGIIDFGDLTHAALVSDIAVALTGIMYRRNNPIDAARSVTRGYADITPIEAEELRLLPDLIMTRLAIKGIMYARAETRYSHNVGGIDAIWDLLAELDEIGCDRIQRQLQVAAASSDSPYSRIETSELMTRRRQVLGSERLSYREPVHFVSGDGVWLFDESGDRYLDAYNNVQSIGHANSRVSAAIDSQNRKLTTNTRYLHESIVELSENLLDTMPDGIDQLLFVNSGSEANDLAWQMATNWTGNSGAIISEYAYHGITNVTKELSPKYWPNGEGADYLETITPPAGASVHRYAATDTVEEVDEALDNQKRSGLGTAALMFDPLFTSDGIFPPSNEALGEVTAQVREAGGISIVDEVQAGFGRTGDSMWGFQKADIVPDIVTIGKPMGNGYPVAAVGTRSEIAEGFREQAGVFSTFGGNPVAATAALAVLHEIERGDILAHADAVGAYLNSRLLSLAAEHDLIGEVRREGLMCGVELVRDREAWTPARKEAEDIVNYLCRHRILIGLTGRGENVLKIRPPLIFERRHVDRLVGTLGAALSEAAATSTQ